MNRPDPIFAGHLQPQLWNRYAYALNRPQTLRDPSGLCPTDYCETVNVTGNVTNVPTIPSGIRGVGHGDQDDLIGIIEENNGYTDQSSGQTATQEVPLQNPENTALQNSLNDLINYHPSQECETKVVKPLQLSWPSFAGYLAQGASFLDGPKSNVPTAGSVYPPTAGASFVRQNPQKATVSQWFASAPGTQAVTSITAPKLTVYLRPSTVDLSNRGSNSRNFSLLFHEGLHGYGAGLKYSDQHLMADLRLGTGSSSRISAKIATSCK